MGDTRNERPEYLATRAQMLAAMAASIAAGMMPNASPDPKLIEAGTYKKLDKQIAQRAVNVAREIANELGL